MSEKGERRIQLEQCAETMGAMAADVEAIGSEIQGLVQQACEIDGKIKTLTARLNTSGASEAMPVCVELSAAVRTRVEISSKAQTLNMRASQLGNRLRSEARKVKPPRIFDTVGKKIFGEAA